MLIQTISTQKEKIQSTTLNGQHPSKVINSIAMVHQWAIQDTGNRWSHQKQQRRLGSGIYGDPIYGKHYESRIDNTSAGPSTITKERTGAPGNKCRL